MNGFRNAVLVAACVAASAGGPAGAESLVMVDDFGVVIGDVLQPNTLLNRARVAYPVGGTSATLYVDQNSFRHGGRPYVFFSRARCRGNAYMLAAGSLPDGDWPMAVAGPGATLYLGEPESAGRFMLRSKSDAAGVCAGLDEEEAQVLGTVTMLEAEPLIDLDREYFPPYRMVTVE